MKSDDKERTDSKQLWKSAFNKIKPAAIKPTTENDIIDTIRVRISVNSDYLQEIAKGKVSHKFFNEIYYFLMLRMEHQIIYDQSSGVLLDHNGNHASTIGAVSKGIEN